VCVEKRVQGVDNKDHAREREREIGRERDRLREREIER